MRGQPRTKYYHGLTRRSTSPSDFRFVPRQQNPRIIANTQRFPLFFLFSSPRRKPPSYRVRYESKKPGDDYLLRTAKLFSLIFEFRSEKLLRLRRRKINPIKNGLEHALPAQFSSRSRFYKLRNIHSAHEHDSLLWRGGEKGGEFRVRFPRLKSSGTTYRASNRAVELIVIRNEEYYPTLPLISMIWAFFWDGSI